MPSSACSLSPATLLLPTLQGHRTFVVFPSMETSPTARVQVVCHTLVITQDGSILFLQDTAGGNSRPVFVSFLPFAIQPNGVWIKMGLHSESFPGAVLPVEEMGVLGAVGDVTASRLLRTLLAWLLLCLQLLSEHVRAKPGLPVVRLTPCRRHLHFCGLLPILGSLRAAWVRAEHSLPAVPQERGSLSVHPLLTCGAQGSELPYAREQAYTTDTGSRGCVGARQSPEPGTCRAHRRTASACALVRSSRLRKRRGLQEVAQPAPAAGCSFPV